MVNPNKINIGMTREEMWSIIGDNASMENYASLGETTMMLKTKNNTLTGTKGCLHSYEILNNQRRLYK